jgi:hypothetical protein
MPTGYTASVATGATTTARDYLLKCARNFGALIHMRDDASDAEIKYAVVGEYNSKRKEEAANEIVRLTALSPAEKHREAEAAHAERVKLCADAAAKDEEQSRAYDRMIAKVNAWEPPTPEHEALKKFAVQQLIDSKEFDCNRAACAPDEIKNSKPESGEAYVWRRISELSRNIEYHTRQHEDEVRRVTQANAWIAALESSL